MNFKVIESQEELDKIISERLAREREKYADYEDIKKSKSDLEKEVSTLTQTIKDKEDAYSDFDSKLNGLTSENETLKLAQMKTKIAYESGIPFGLASRLKGNDEESLQADASALAELVKTGEYVPPLKETEVSSAAKNDQKYLDLLGEGE